LAFVLQCLLDNLAGLDIQHRNRLLSRMQVHAYNLHLGLLGSELCRVNTAKFTRTVRRPTSLCHQGLSPVIHSGMSRTALFRQTIAARSTEHLREPSEWHCSHSRADSTPASRAVFGLPYPSPGRKSLWNQ